MTGLRLRFHKEFERLKRKRPSFYSNKVKSNDYEQGLWDDMVYRLEIHKKSPNSSTRLVLKGRERG